MSNFINSSVSNKIVICSIFGFLIAGCGEPRELTVSRAIYHNCTSAWVTKHDLPRSELTIYTAIKPMPVKQNRDNFGTDLFYILHHSVVYAKLKIGCMTDANFQVLQVFTKDLSKTSEEVAKRKIDLGAKFRRYHKFN